MSIWIFLIEIGVLFRSRTWMWYDKFGESIAGASPRAAGLDFPPDGRLMGFCLELKERWMNRVSGDTQQRGYCADPYEGRILGISDSRNTLYMGATRSPGRTVHSHFDFRHSIHGVVSLQFVW